MSSVSGNCGVATAVFVALLTMSFAVAPGADDLDLREQEAFRAAVDRVAPSVVRIETVGGLERVGKMLTGTGPTTGLIVTPDGYLISSAFNFVGQPASILAHLPDKTRKSARLVASDHNRMLVLLKIEVDKPLPIADIVPQDQMRVGQWAIAVGRTFETSQPNMTVGVLSALNRIWGKAIQTDAAVSPNNYGGPLIDISGRVLGVLVPLSPQQAAETAGTEWYDSGIGFAIPAEAIHKILPVLKQGKDMWPGAIGIQFSGRSLFTSEPAIAAVRPNSPAHRAGLKADDRIVEIGGRQITLAAQAKEEISRRYAGDKVQMVVMRGGRRSQHEVELVQRLPPYEHPFLGVLPMREPIKETEDAKAAAGVRIRYVFPKSPAAQAGVTTADVLQTVAGEKVADAAQVRQKLCGYVPGDKIEIGLRRGDQVVHVNVALGRQPETVPSGELPPAWSHVPAAQGEQPKSGKIPLKVPEFKNDAWAYVPGNYSSAIAQGLVIWLHGPGGNQDNELLARWKSHCQRDRLILLVPESADAATWQPKEAAFVVRLLAEVAAIYRVAPSRTVVFGREGGGRLAYLAALAARDFVEGVATIDAPLEIPTPENEPTHRLAFYLAKAEKSLAGRQVDETIAGLRALKYPVTVKSLGPEPRDLSRDELSELLRWIDTLDGI